MPIVLVEENDNHKVHIARLRLFAKAAEPLDLVDFSFEWKQGVDKVAWYQ
jgi:hypothetical protein